MADYYIELLKKYYSKGILIDTNLLLIFIIGMCDKNYIATFKRTKTFSSEDYDILFHILQPFCKIITTPNILTEVSNHLGFLEESLKQKVLKTYF